jgi:hypothetical protein
LEAMKVYVLEHINEEYSGIQGIYLSKTKAEQDKLELEQKEIERSFKDLLSYYSDFTPEERAFVEQEEGYGFFSVEHVQSIEKDAKSSVEYWYIINEHEVIE